MSHHVFIGLTDVAGYFGSLADGFRSLGVPCTVIDESPDFYQYRRLTVHGRLGRAQAYMGDRAGRGPFRLVWGLGLLMLRMVRVPLRLSALLVALYRCDVFIFTSGDGFLKGLELPLLQRLGKRIIWVFTGSDHRPPYLNGRYIRRAEREGWNYLAAESERIAARVARVERHADVIVAHAASAQFHTRSFVDFLALGIPVPVVGSVGEATIDDQSASSGRVRIMHCPSDLESKGTAAIRGVIHSLIRDGLPVDYEEVMGRPHAEVLQALGRADLLVDEVYGDTPMGVIASEAAAHGVPTVCGGYYATIVGALGRDDDAPPSRFVAPEDLEAAIRELVVNGNERAALGREARAFVTQRWRPEGVAERYLRLLDGSVPSTWLLDPNALDYIGGWGISQIERRSALAAFLASCGGQALALPPHSPIRGRVMAEIAGL